MKTFKEASEYITSTYSYDIFSRVALYVVWGDYKYRKKFGNPVIPMIVASFAGPFDGFKNDAFQDQGIKDLLILSDWGWKTEYNEVFKQWALKYCKSKEDIAHFHNVVNIAIKKSQKVQALLEENSEKRVPIELYFPELKPSGYLQKNNWPRV